MAVLTKESKERVFRKAALDRLRSPEQLDQLVRATEPKSWIILLATGLLLASAIVWAVAGTLPRRLGGEGLLVGTGGLLDVVSTGAGQISRLYAKPGDRLERGQV